MKIIATKDGLTGRITALSLKSHSFAEEQFLSELASVFEPRVKGCIGSARPDADERTAMVLTLCEGDKRRSITYEIVRAQKISYPQAEEKTRTGIWGLSRMTLTAIIAGLIAANIITATIKLFSGIRL